MADLRISVPTRVVDMTTVTQGLTVDNGNAHVDIMRINNVAVLMGNGNTGTGSLRVTIAADNTPHPIKIDQTTPGTTNLVAANIVSINGTAAEVAAGGIIKIGLTDGNGVEVNLGQAAMAASLPVVLASDQPALPVTVGSPTNPAWDVVDAATPLTIAAAATADSDTGDIPGKKLRACYVSGSAFFKVSIGLLSDVTFTNRVVLFGGPTNPVTFQPPHEDFMEAPAAASGVQGFRATVKNLDTDDTADFYVSWAYQD